MAVDRPMNLTEDHLIYLDDLRESGETNMWGAPPYVQDEFGLSLTEARQITLYWMQTFAERHKNDSTT